MTHRARHVGVARRWSRWGWSGAPARPDAGSWSRRTSSGMCSAPDGSPRATAARAEPRIRLRARPLQLRRRDRAEHRLEPRGGLSERHRRAKPPSSVRARRSAPSGVSRTAQVTRWPAPPLPYWAGLIPSVAGCRVGASRGRSRSPPRAMLGDRPPARSWPSPTARPRRRHELLRREPRVLLKVFCRCAAGLARWPGRARPGSGAPRDPPAGATHFSTSASEGSWAS